ncbi:MAG: phosphoribosylformylglycinamidine cyclo-ligase [Xanthomonadales bacterium]|nr:phosphoribosylformylglycinamidine cyclo-ligase [Xanthomonadales bacterium]MBN8794587.1 phosphoribosylformylglycinamidine cyclo-ligase [Stenotrophomonas nitritireducens]
MLPQPGGRVHDRARRRQPAAVKIARFPRLPEPAVTSQPPSSPGLTYRDAGVDIDAGNAVVERIKPLVRRTLRPEVLGGVGLFGGLFDLAGRYKEPVLVSGTDGVGTKLILARQLNRHDTIGQDLVAMCVNDVLVQGAEPLFFLDYFATGKLDVESTVNVVAGIARGCELAGCALIGGETAEMPDMYPPGEYDLAGFTVGAVEKAKLVDSSKLRAGDVLIGLASSGPHSNGYSLVRRILERAGSPLDLDLGGTTLADALMEPTRIYVKPVLELLARHDIHAMAHVTGGALVEKIIRVVPAPLGLDIDTSSWPRPAVFDWLQREGNVADAEMWRTFNCGIGYVLMADPADVAAIEADLDRLALAHWRIGQVTAPRDGERLRIG